MNYVKSIIISLVVFCIISNGSFALNNAKDKSTTDIQHISLEFHFSDPQIFIENESIWVYVNESDLNMVKPNYPILPVNITNLNFMFGTKITNIEYETSYPEIFNISGRLAVGKKPNFDTSKLIDKEIDLTELSDSYPLDWIYYHTGGGLYDNEHATFMVLRVYPVRYFEELQQLWFISDISVNVSYEEPEKPLIEDKNVYDLLIISPKDFIKPLEKLVKHKNDFGVKTKLVDTCEIYDQMYWYGRDNQEKIKYYIKYAIEYWGIEYVLLVGGIKGQTFKWNLPARYSRVVPTEEQEYAEQSFISDLYFADIYNSTGDFSSWDSNDDNLFSVWNETFKDDMDLYPDVYLGRLPCRNDREVRIMVNKIINYEKEPCDESWFNNLLLVAGDSYNDENGFNEGVLISEKAIELMPGFTPVRVYASSDLDINRRTVNKELNKGAGFAYFCGHGSPKTWTTHFPPDGTEWTTGYDIGDMIYLRNRYKLPITVVGGCHNGQFDVTMMNIIKGVIEDGLHYFSPKAGNAGQFWYNAWVPNCWGWFLTSKSKGGSIAAIANTGLGTHGDGDLDNNGVADYLELLDGWLELRFLQLYGEEQKNILGENHGIAITEYLHRFYGSDEKMDVKMIQQWELLGDPSLKIAGYS